MSNFKEQVLKYIRAVPRGRVVSYGQVAAACGHPRAARQVGGILKSLDISNQRMPWWRVINNRGVITIKGNWTADKKLQKKLLEKDGVLIDADFQIDMAKYRYLQK